MIIIVSYVQLVCVNGAMLFSVYVEVDWYWYGYTNTRFVNDQFVCY